MNYYLIFLVKKSKIRKIDNKKRKNDYDDKTRLDLLKNLVAGKFLSIYLFIDDIFNN